MIKIKFLYRNLCKIFTNVFLAFAFIITSLPAGLQASYTLDHVVAIVNSDVITNSELAKSIKLILARINQQQIKLPPKEVLEQQVLNQMILDKIQLQLANKLGIEADSNSIDETINEIAQENKLNMAEFRQKVEQEGINFTDFRENIKQEVIISRLRQREIGQEIVISSADIDGFLNSLAGQDHTGTEYHLGHILIAAQENSPTPENIEKYKHQAESLIKSLKEGVNFAQMAIAKSSGQQALQGGDLGWRKLGELPALFVKYLPTMEIDEVAGPIRSVNGFHIIKLLGKRVGKESLHTETHVRHILIKPGINLSEAEAETNIKEIRKQIVNGAKFATIAEKKSEELSTAVKGGDLGWISASSVTPEFYSQVMSLSPGTLSQPFKTALGWHLIEVLARRSQNTSSDAARNQAQEVIRQRKYQDLVETWLKRIRSEAKVEILTK